MNFQSMTHQIPTNPARTCLIVFNTRGTYYPAGNLLVSSDKPRWERWNQGVGEQDIVVMNIHWPFEPKLEVPTIYCWPIFQD